MPLFKKASEKDTSRSDIEKLQVDTSTVTETESNTESNAAIPSQKSPVLHKSSAVIKTFIGKEPAPIVQTTEIYPFLRANFLSKLTFSWVSPLIKKGYLRRIEDEDLYILDGDLKVREITEKFEINLDKRIAEWQEKHPDKERFTKIVVIKALNDTFKRQFWTGGAAKVVADLGQMLNPLLVRTLVKFIQDRGESKVVPHVGHAIGASIGISCLLVLSSLGIANFFHLSMLTGAQCKALLTNIIYRKAFKLSAKARLDFPNGKVNSMVMADLARIDLAIGTFHFVWSFPIAFCVGLIVLVVNLGAPALLGLALILVLLGYMFYSTRQLKSLRKKSFGFIDKRVRAINEIVNSLKMIKFYCWEIPYYKAVERFRLNEKKFILKIQLLKASVNSGVASVSILATMVTFLTMYKLDTRFQSYNIFSAVTLFNTLRFPLNLLPMATGFLVDALLAMDRVAEFLQAEEAADTVQRLEYNESSNAIVIENGSFEWDVEEELTQVPTGTRHQPVKNKKNWKSKFTKKRAGNPSEASGAPETESSTGVVRLDPEEEEGDDLSFPGLKNINLTIKKNELIIVTGSIGTGKSSLLNAIEGSMRKTLGDSKVYGSLTFCSYPWIQNETIKENILFGLPYIKEKYDAIVQACSLDVDFTILPDGDQTEVGERGITLSGGQKARINLARAVYADRDIILLDDVLSAVDARVGKHIMNECICGLLKDKTRVLATHQLSLIGAAERIVVLDGAGSIDVGTYSELMARNEAFKKLMDFNKEEELEEEEEIEETEELELEHQQTQLSRIKSTKIDDENARKEKGKITKDEIRSSQKVSLRLYIDYMILGSGKLGFAIVPIFVILVILNGYLQLFHSVWLSFWLQDKFNISSGAYMGIYAMFCFLASFSFVALFGTIAALNNFAGLNLFNLSAKKLLKTPMWFMDITPTGRILNRFTKDVDVLDTDMIEQLRLFIQSIALIGGVVILCGVYIPWFFLILPFVFVLYYYLAHYYKTSALDIKRLESVKRSFVFSHFNESLSGMKVIKSYGSADRFKDRYEALIDNMDSAYFLTLANQRWLSIRLDFFSSIVSFFVAILCVCGVFNMSGASSGLLVSYIVQVASMMSLLLRSMTQLENDMNSVERLFEYARELPEEGPFEKKDTKPAESWPEKGSITFEDVSLSYREGLPLVLKDVSFNVKPSEKIGICGRTGAGKSTVMNALFRVNELSEGRVIIDDVDISRIGLNDLRSKLSIIPQDPVLFRGTIRQNLDPFGKSSDIELWDALKRSWLVEEGSKGTGEYTAGESALKTLHKFHLDQRVEDDGANFSLGERQLLALARALVRNTKILILDEATSSVDYETDAKIQSTIINEFKNCSILCIAHRLKTILNYDRIMVLDKGEIKEFDTPLKLFQQGGIFTEMCQRSNITVNDF